MNVIKRGKSNKIITCSNCDAIIEYNGADLEKGIILDCKISNFKRAKKLVSYTTYVDRFKCPECGNYIIDNKYYKKDILPNLIGN